MAEDQSFSPVKQAFALLTLPIPLLQTLISWMRIDGKGVE
jgi:hypothetical protein